MSSFNYSKWDAIGESDTESDDDREAAIKRAVKEKEAAVSVPQALAANPRSEVLLEEGNRVVNAIIERNPGRELGPDERAGYAKAATIYRKALGELREDEPSLASRLHLNVATCHWQLSEFALALRAARTARKLGGHPDGDDKAEEIENACARELRNASLKRGGCDHQALGDAALDAKDFAAAETHFGALADDYAGAANEDEIHALAHLALCYEQQSRFALAGDTYAKAAEACGDDVKAGGEATPRRSQLRDRAAKCYGRADDADRATQGSERVRNSQLQRLISRSFSTRFG